MLPFLLLSPRRSPAVAGAEYRDFLRAAGLEEEQLVHRMLDSENSRLGDLRGLSGVFVGGSDLNVTDARHSRWQQNVNVQLAGLLAAPVPVLSVCYGGSAIARSTGGEIGRTHPENAGATTVELTAAGKADPVFGALPASFTALTGHTENITALGPNATLLATGPSCPVQAVRYGERLWTCQFHSEMDADAMRVRMGFFHGHGYYDDAEFDAIVSGLPLVDTSAPRTLLRSFVAHAAADAARRRARAVADAHVPALVG